MDIHINTHTKCVTLLFYGCSNWCLRDDFHSRKQMIRAKRIKTIKYWKPIQIGEPLWVHFYHLSNKERQQKGFCGWSYICTQGVKNKKEINKQWDQHIWFSWCLQNMENRWYFLKFLHRILYTSIRREENWLHCRSNKSEFLHNRVIKLCSTLCH